MEKKEWPPFDNDGKIIKNVQVPSVKEIKANSMTEEEEKKRMEEIEDRMWSWGIHPDTVID